ncbi:class I SAM-dependent methyltransferase [Kutzneria chonburiensis]|uniref:Class I SAM-dependent methyltransferase n=1 Tax=Kutzneria chonburiensis TaxID=1483604 RepID=A0ABV6MS66_9PSEU|nr:class I SAM-dependent methyltransferase [Kutzneria chonburiensis]
MPWYTDFFTEPANTFWRGAVAQEQTVAEIDFVLAVTGIQPGARVLDVPCGSGRHSIELARRGCDVTGLDVSTEAITHARQSEVDVDWRLADFADLASHGLSADVAICMGNSFGYLDHAANQRFLADLAAAAPTLVIDYGCVAEAILPHPPGEITMSAGGVDMIAVNHYDPAQARLLIDFTFTMGERTQQATCVQHVYTAGELSRMLTAAGYREVDLYGDTDRTEFHLGSHRLLAVARR